MSCSSLFFVLSCLHSANFLNNMFCFNKKIPRNDSLNLFYEPKCKRKTESISVKYRAKKLFNCLAKQNLLDNVENLNSKQLSNFYHKLKDFYILNNDELVKRYFFLIGTQKIQTPSTCYRSTQK